MAGEVIYHPDGSRTHAYIRTFTGHRVHVHDPARALADRAIHILDIAHALSMVCRFNGHCNEFYSVAQHCVLVARAANPADKMWALLHDAHEAYLGDLVSPLKNRMPEWKTLESAWDVVIRARFAAPGSADQRARIKALDLLLLGRELLDLFDSQDGKLLGFLDARRPHHLAPITPWSHQKAKRMFMHAYYLYSGRPWWQRVLAFFGVYWGL